MAKKLRGFIFNNCGSFMEIKLTKAAVESFPRYGKVDDAVEEWVQKLRPYIDEITPEFIKACLKPIGAWDDEELQEKEQNIRRFVCEFFAGAKEAKAQGEKGYLWVYMETY